MMILNSSSPVNNYDFRASLSRQSERGKNAIHYFSRNLMDVSAGNSLDSCIGVIETEIGQPNMIASMAF